MRMLLTGKDGQVGFELQHAMAPLGEIAAVDVEECDLSSSDVIQKRLFGLRLPPVNRLSWYWPMCCRLPRQIIRYQPRVELIPDLIQHTFGIELPGWEVGLDDAPQKFCDERLKS